MKEMKNAVRILHSESCIIGEVHASEVFYTLTNQNLPVAFVVDVVTVLWCMKLSCKSRIVRACNFLISFCRFLSVCITGVSGKIS